VSNQVASVNFFLPVQDQLKQVEELMLRQADDRHPDLDAALKHLLSSGGKRIRPAIALLTGLMLDGDPQRLITLAAAIELLHTATLVHDDLIDGAFLRRGIATLNSRWSPAATVLTGDFIFSRAAKLAAETNSLVVMRLFAETLTTIVNGEITQLFSGRGDVNRANYDKRIHAKTASLFELATAGAAILSPVDQKTIERVGYFGYWLGMAFQIVDDVLDFTSEQAILGKPVASDLRQGLITLPSLYYLENFPNDPIMHRILQGERVSDTEVTSLVEAIRESGAIHRSMQQAESFVADGTGYLAVMPENPARMALEDLAKYLVQREI
jgi:geranylgeranyl pyrophosphate synthase